MSNVNNAFKEIIKAYLDKRAQEDELFAKAYAKEGKSLDECCKYIMSEARKYAEGNAVCVPDAEVYGWAVHYYDEAVVEFEDLEKVCEVKVERPEPKYPTVQPKKERVKKKVAPVVEGSPFVQLSLF